MELIGRNIKDINVVNEVVNNQVQIVHRSEMSLGFSSEHGTCTGSLEVAISDVETNGNLLYIGLTVAGTYECEKPAGEDEAFTVYCNVYEELFPYCSDHFATLLQMLGIPAFDLPKAEPSRDAFSYTDPDEEVVVL